MYNSSEVSKLKNAILEINQHAATQGRQLTPTERRLQRTIETQIDDLSSSSPLTHQPAHEISSGDFSNTVRSHSKPFALRGPKDSKAYHDLFGKEGGHTWEDKNISFWGALFSGRHHPGLIKNAMTETTPSGGGYLLPTETAAAIHSVALENEIVQPLALVQPMSSNELNLPATTIGSHSSNLYGGFSAAYVDESGTIAEHSPSFRQLLLKTKKLVGMLEFSNELIQDVPGAEDQIIQICGKGLAWFRDMYFLKGTGAGQPLGVLNSPCLITVTAESGQDSSSLMYENFCHLMGSMFSGSFGNSVWVIHQSCIPELLKLSISIGTGGVFVPVMSNVNGQFTILTRPVIFTEKTFPLGTKGDVLLADFSQLVIGLRGEMRIDLSPHIAFSSDMLYARLVERHDSQPLWDKALTLEDGVTKVSPFCVLASRT